MSDLLTQAEIVRKLNREVPKELKPRSGKITTANFSMKLRNGEISFAEEVNGRKMFNWDDVAPAFGVSPGRKKDIAKKAKEEASKIVCEITDGSEMESILEDFETTLADRLLRATTSKQEIEIEKMSFDALMKKLEAKEKVRTLIPIDEAKSTMEYVLGNVKGKVYELQSKLQTRFTKLEDDDIHEIGDMIDDIFKDLSSGESF